MCVIATHDDRARITHEEWNEAWKANPDGGGIAWIMEGKVHTFKSMDRDTLWNRYLEVTKSAEVVLVHMRIATHGSRNLANCHPFPVSDGRQVIAHNGILTQLTGELGKDESDSRALVRLVLRHLPPAWTDNPGMVELVSDYLNGDRLAVLTVDSKNPIALFGDWETDKAGIDWSNRYHKRRYSYTPRGREDDWGRGFLATAPCEDCKAYHRHRDTCPSGRAGELVYGSDDHDLEPVAYFPEGIDWERPQGDIVTDFLAADKDGYCQGCYWDPCQCGIVCPDCTRPLSLCRCRDADDMGVGDWTPAHRGGYEE